MTTIASPLSAVKTTLDLSLFNSLIVCNYALLIIDLGEWELLRTIFIWALGSCASCFGHTDSTVVMYSKCGGCLRAVA